MNIEGWLVESGDPVRIVIKGSQVSEIQHLDRAPNLWIAPGFIDIQVNGYGGHDANAPDVSPATIVEMVRALWRRGVAAVCPTVITQSEAHICRCLEAIASARKSDPLIRHAIPCIHVEGPYLSCEDGPRGAHPLEQIRPPSVAEFRRWQETAEGLVGIVTLSPEHPESVEYIRDVTAENVIISIGHTAANDEQIRAAVAAGARLSTHLGNGAHAQLRRHPNYIWDQLADDRLMASMIFDGHHLPPAVMKAMVRAKGVERSILTSDAVALAGLEPGVYETAVGGKVELLPSGRLNLYGTPYLAGSASSLPDGIANAVRHAGLTVREAVRMATANPARLLQLDGPRGRGSVRAGAAGDFTVFRLDELSGELIIEQTIVNGELVYRREP